MLNAVNSSVRTLVHDRGLIDALDVDVTFEVPSEEWATSVTRPTVNFFLFDLYENTDKRDGAPQTSVIGGRAERRLPPRRIDLHYLVSVVTGDVEDEHELLWRVLKTLMKHQQFPPEILSEALRTVSPPIVARIAARDDGRHLLDIWNALKTEPHPALCYVVTAPMDLAIATESPLVLTRTARYRRTTGVRQSVHGTSAATGAMAAEEVRIQIGGTVRNSCGEPVADVTVVPDGWGSGAVTATDGRYVLHGLSEGVVTLMVGRGGRRLKPVQVQVPGVSYDIVLDGE
jgi:hypothetical protein